MQYFMHQLQFSGYNHSDRTTVYLKARTTFKISNETTTGEVPMYRKKFQNREEQVRVKKEKRKSWYKKGDREMPRLKWHCQIALVKSSKKLEFNVSEWLNRVELRSRVIWLGQTRSLVCLATDTFVAVVSRR